MHSCGTKPVALLPSIFGCCTVAYRVIKHGSHWWNSREDVLS